MTKHLTNNGSLGPVNSLRFDVRVTAENDAHSSIMEIHTEMHFYQTRCTMQNGNLMIINCILCSYLRHISVHCHTMLQQCN